jgi:hypothetical protein
MYYPYEHMNRVVFAGGGGGGLGCIWFIGWLFTIGYLRLSFGRGVLAIVIWPYYLGKKFHKAS